MTSGMGLRTKATLGIAGIVILLGLAVIIIAKPAFYQKLFVTFQKRGISIARNIAANFAGPYQRNFVRGTDSDRGSNE